MSQSKLPIPSDFNTTYAHDNIAFDVTSQRVWLRNGQRSKVFTKGDILDWQVEYGTVKAPDVYAGGVINRGTQTKTDIRLAVQTKDMEHPVYKVRFERHSKWLHGERNFEDANAWSNRMTAFRNS